MPTIYLSPSIQPYNKYLTEGDEQYWMNRIADDMVPMLEQNGIKVVRNTPNTSLGQAIRESNAGNYPYSASGKRAAELIADELRKIYPDPDLVSTVATTRLAEITKTSAPAVLVEIAYHDNAEDEAWIRNNITVIAEALTRAVCAYLEMNCAL